MTPPALFGALLWVIGEDDVAPPSFPTPCLARLVRIAEPGLRAKCLALIRPILSFDWKLAGHHGGHVDATVADIPLQSLLEDLRTSEQPVLLSCDRRSAADFARQLDRAVYWVSIDGIGATQRHALWKPWLAGSPTVRLQLDLIESGTFSLVAAREFRLLPGPSPALSHQALLTAASWMVQRVRSRLAGPAVKPTSAAMDPRETQFVCVLGLMVALDMMFRRLAVRLTRPKADQWMIGICRRGGTDRGPGLPVPISEFLWIEPGADRHAADPFIISLAGETALFFEELRYAEGKGRLKAVALDDAGRPLGEEHTILQREFHLSFPNAFRIPSDPTGVYLLPEQAESGQTVLYRGELCTKVAELRFLEYAVLLRNFAGIDPVLHERNGHWYLFVSDGEFGHHDNNLHLFTADLLQGPYTEHPASPVRLGLRGSRMAGQIIRRENHLYRPAQDCVRRYGERIRIYRIDELTPSTYLESEISEVACGQSIQGFVGVHTMNESTDFTAIDAVRRRAT